MLVDQRTENVHIPLNSLDKDQGKLEVGLLYHGFMGEEGEKGGGRGSDAPFPLTLGTHSLLLLEHVGGKQSSLGVCRLGI